MNAVKLAALWFSLRGCRPSPSSLLVPNMTLPQGGVRNPKFWNDYKWTTNLFFISLSQVTGFQGSEGCVVLPVVAFTW